MFDSRFIQQTSLLQKLRTDPEAHAAKYAMGTGHGLFPRV